MKTKCKPLFPESPRSRRSRARAKAKARTRAKAKAGEIALAKSSWKTSSPAVRVPPERLDARATSQYYRDKAKKEFKNLVNANLALRRHNEALRAQWHSDLNFALTKKPAHSDVTSKASRASSMPYLPGETRKERNRRAAKKSREAAKLRVRKVKEENSLLAKDNKFLAHRLTEAGIAVDIEAAGVLSDATEPLSGHRSPTLQSRPSKRRKKSFGGQLKQIGGIGCFSALMIFAAVALISSDMSCHEQPCSESPGTNTNGFGIAAKVGMSLERAMATSFDSSLSILASSLCFISLLFGVASHFRREVYKL